MKLIKAVFSVAKVRTIPTTREAPVLVRMEEAKTYTVEATLKYDDGNRLSVVKEVVETLSRQPFYIMVVNTSK